MRNILAKAFNNRFIRFLFTGGINTIITYGVYLVLLEAVNYQISYLFLGRIRVGGRLHFIL